MSRSVLLRSPYGSPARWRRFSPALGSGSSSRATAGRSRPRPSRTSGWPSAALAAALGCAWAAWRNRGPLRRVWVLLGLSSLSWGTGQVIWTWYESVLGRDVPFPSLADFGYLGAVPFAAAALLGCRPPAQTHGRPCPHRHRWADDRLLDTPNELGARPRPAVPRRRRRPALAVDQPRLSDRRRRRGDDRALRLPACAADERSRPASRSASSAAASSRSRSPTAASPI